jgi:hypothetical protein
MYNFQAIYDLNKNLKTLLENDFAQVYIEQKTNVLENKKRDKQSDLSFFEIKPDKSSIFSKITSADKLMEVKKEIKDYYERFSNNFLDYFARVEDKLDAKNIKSFEIIEKTIKNRGKKLNSTIDKFQVQDSWNISKIQEEFYFKLHNNFKDIIENLIPTISTGMKDNTAYQGVLTDLNKFLSELGIYTMKLKLDEKCDTDFLEPQPCEDCETTDMAKKETIKEILSYPYLLNDKQIICEGKVFLWRIVHNG